MSNAQQIYQDNVGHTHSAAVEAVFAAGLEAGKVLGNTTTETVTLDPNPDLEAQVVTLTKAIDDATVHIADLGGMITAAETMINEQVTSLSAAEAKILELEDHIASMPSIPVEAPAAPAA